MTTSNVREEITTVTTQTPLKVTPAVQSEAPQKVFNKKKTIFRFNQVIWYIVGVIEVLLAFRILLKALGANQYIGFTSFIYALTEPFAGPFRGILGLSVTGKSVIEWSTLIAAIVYVCIAWGLVYLLDLFFPITPSDVETE